MFLTLLGYTSLKTTHGPKKFNLFLFFFVRGSGPCMSYSLYRFSSILVMFSAPSIEGSPDEVPQPLGSSQPLSSSQPCVTERHVAFSKDFIIGLVLAISSSIFIGESSET